MTYKERADSSDTVNPLLAQLTHKPFPMLANVLRLEVDRITHAWDAAVREAMPQMRHLTFDELKDSTPTILYAIADALESDDPAVIRELMERAPNQGLSRLELSFDVIEVMQEDRLLRAIIVERVEAGMIGRMEAVEAAALHAAIDVMLQRSVIALVEKQKAQLRVAAKREAKFLAFLTHDMNNNLVAVKLRLYFLQIELKRTGQFAAAEESLKQLQHSIEMTTTGMLRMLDHEQLRSSGRVATFVTVDLHALAAYVLKGILLEADLKSLTLVNDVLPGTTAESDPELLMMILQNLMGNAVKYSTCGTIHISSDTTSHHAGGFVLRVSDEGPGIDSEKIGQIFEAFKRGDQHGQQGVGLGLAIASQAAKLLGAELTVESQIGIGSTFQVDLWDIRTLARTP